MNTEQASYMADIMKAWSKGEEVEYRIYYKTSGEWSEWFPIPATPTFILEGESTSYEYRIKPVPSTRSYNMHEFLNAMKEHGPSLTLDYGSDYLYYIPTNVNGLGFHVLYNGKEQFYSFSDIASDYVWQDGTPCNIPI